jgi:hypothetical protein
MNMQFAQQDHHLFQKGVQVTLLHATVCLIFVLLFTRVVWAESRSPLQVDAPAKDSAFFAEGTRFWSVIAGMAEDEPTELGKITLARLTVSHYIRDHLALLYGIGCDYVNASKVKNGWQGGLQLGLRRHFIHRGRWTVYIDGLVGLVYHQNPLEEGSYPFNFDVQAGFGVTYRLTEASALRGGYRHFHMSNAGIGGRERNLGYDAPMFYVGFMQSF